MRDSGQPVPSPVSRRLFVSRLGAFGLGAVGATTLLTACGGDRATNPSVSGINVTAFSSQFQDIQQDEANHVAFLNAALGAAARPAPTFDTSQAVWNPPDVNTFLALADALENTGTGAYLYAVTAPALLAAPTVLQDAASIAIVEGRHAGFLNALTGRPLLTDPRVPGDNTQPVTSPIDGGADLSRDVPEPPSLVGQRAAPFLVNLNLNGGPGLPSDNLSGAAVADILNYALLLEYLEADWYARNVPRFFGAPR